MPEAEANVGKFMVAVGAIIVHTKTQKLLLVQRDSTNHLKDEWEITYGRIDQFEELSDGLKREVFEETGLENVKMEKLLRIWHIYRGEMTAEKEIYGFTFVCSTESDEVKLSREHSQYKWVDAKEALQYIKVPGIRQDVELYQKYLENKNVQPVISNTENEIYFKN